MLSQGLPRSAPLQRCGQRVGRSHKDNVARSRVTLPQCYEFYRPRTALRTLPSLPITEEWHAALSACRTASGRERFKRNRLGCALGLPLTLSALCHSSVSVSVTMQLQHSQLSLPDRVAGTSSAFPPPIRVSRRPRYTARCRSAVTASVIAEIEAEQPKLLELPPQESAGQWSGSCPRAARFSLPSNYDCSTSMLDMCYEASDSLLSSLPAVDDLSLRNPLKRAERMNTGWFGVIMEYEGVLVEDTYEAQQSAWLKVAQELGYPRPLGHLFR